MLFLLKFYFFFEGQTYIRTKIFLQLVHSPNTHLQGQDWALVGAVRGTQMLRQEAGVLGDILALPPSVRPLLFMFSILTRSLSH